MTGKRLALLLAALAIVAVAAALTTHGDGSGLLGRFGIGPPPE